MALLSSQTLLGAAAVSLALAAPFTILPAAAQDYGYGPDAAYSAPDEDVTVTAPRGEYHVQHRAGRRPLGWAPQKVSLSEAVPAGDLDLATRRGAYELRARVREAAARICDQLRYDVPHQTPGSPNCYREAVENGLIKADEKIIAARGRYWRAAEYRDGDRD